MRGKKYSDEDMERGLQALVEAGGNCAEASRKTDIPATTLRGWKAKQFADEFVQLRREKRATAIDEVWEAVHETVNEIRTNIPGMAIGKLLRTFGLLTDKGLAMGGEPGSRIDITSGDRPLEGGSEDERIERLFSIIDKARTRRDSEPGD